MICLGVMSGSSLDGIDIALVDFNFENDLKWTLLAAHTFSIPEDLKKRLSQIIKKTPDVVAVTQSIYTDVVAESINLFLTHNSINKEHVDCCSIHGHTILHFPDKKVSWQMLNAGLVAELTGLTTISDFRNQDIALGGQGTPMAVIADRDLFPGYDIYVNLGGIANVSLKEQDAWTAYDLCPCNQVFNYFALKEGLVYDEGGKIAQRGMIDQKALKNWLEEAYIRKEGPKSIDNQWIKSYWIKMMENSKLSSKDFLRTYVEFVSQLLIDLIQSGGTSFFFTGGGAHNSFLMDRMKERIDGQGEIHLPNANVIDFKESILMAYVGCLRLKKQTNFVASATGASADSIGGAVYLSSQSSRR